MKTDSAKTSDQFYKATSNGVVSEADLEEIKRQIDRVYEQGISSAA